MSKAKTCKVIDRLKREQEVLTKARDRLSDIADDAANEYENCREAVEGLEDCIRKLSEIH